MLLNVVIQRFSDIFSLILIGFGVVIVTYFFILGLLFFIKRNWFKKILLPLTVFTIIALGFFGFMTYRLGQGEAIEVQGIPFYRHANSAFEQDKQIRLSDFVFDDGGAGDMPVNLYIAGLSEANRLFTSPEELKELLVERRESPLAEITYLANVVERSRRPIKDSENYETEEVEKITHEFVTNTIKASDIERLRLMESYHQTLDAFEKELDDYLKVQ